MIPLRNEKFLKPTIFSCFRDVIVKVGIAKANITVYKTTSILYKGLSGNYIKVHLRECLCKSGPVDFA